MINNKCKITDKKIEFRDLTKLHDGTPISFAVYMNLCQEMSKSNFTASEARQQHEWLNNFIWVTKKYLTFLKQYAEHSNISENKALELFMEMEEAHAEHLYSKGASCLTKYELANVQKDILLQLKEQEPEIKEVKVGHHNGQTSFKSFDKYWKYHEFENNRYAVRDF